MFDFFKEYFGNIYTNATELYNFLSNLDTILLSIIAIVLFVLVIIVIFIPIILPLIKFTFYILYKIFVYIGKSSLKKATNELKKYSINNIRKGFDVLMNHTEDIPTNKKK